MTAIDQTRDQKPFVECTFSRDRRSEIQALFEHEAEDHGFVFEDMGGDVFFIETPVGRITLNLTEEACIRLTSDSEKTLYYLKESIDADLSAAGFQASWLGTLPQNSCPPSFSKAKIVGKQKINDVFLRVSVQPDDIHKFCKDGIHFRIVYPKHRGVEAQWPYINEARRTIWPMGEKELMKPIYTIRTIDLNAGSFDFDIFLHEDGPTATWGHEVEIGEEVGLLGPAGGWMPQAEDMILAGDETALPAIARILENLPEQTRGAVFVSLENPQGQVDLNVPQNMSLQWIHRPVGDHDLLFELVKDAAQPSEAERYIWFAAKKSVAKKARDHFTKNLGYNNKNSYIAGYWQ